MEKYLLGPDPYLSSYKMYASVTTLTLLLSCEDHSGRKTDSIILSKEQALKLAELIKQKYVCKSE
jgi:hypothetical protein